MINYLENYSLHAFPAHNLNRDQSQMNKTLEIGGSLRSRISSQAIKRSVRTRRNHAGKRASNEQIAELLQQELQLTDEHTQWVKAALKNLVKDGKKKTKDTKEDGSEGKAEKSALVYIDYSALKQALQSFLQDDTSQEDLEQLVNDTTKAISPDIAMNGRMLANAHLHKVTSAIQYAHSYSTHPIFLGEDFWVAIDDLKIETQGAGIMGSRSFASAVMFGHTNLSIAQYRDNLALSEDDTTVFSGISDYMYDWANSLPQGSNSHMLSDSSPLVLITAGHDNLESKLGIYDCFMTPVNGADVRLSSIGKLAYAVKATNKQNRPVIVYLRQDVADEAVAIDGKSLDIHNLWEGENITIVHELSQYRDAIQSLISE
jgi:CRISPR system Cascade subunit CasC